MSVLSKTGLFILLILLIGSCKTAPKPDLPFAGTPPLITFSKIVTTSAGERDKNYERVMKRVLELVPDAKVRNDDKKNYYFNIRGSLKYKRRISTRSCSYLVHYLCENDQTTISILQIWMNGAPLEQAYFKKRTKRKLLEEYNTIHHTLNNLLNELVKELK